MNNSFKYWELPCGDGSLAVEVKKEDDMRQLFAKIKDYAYYVSGNKFEGYSSWKLHKAAEALSELWETAHAMSDAILMLQNKVENLVYSREDEEAYEAEEEGAYQEHRSYMNSCCSGSRI